MTIQSPADPPRSEPLFVAVRAAIMRGSERVAVAVSHSMARRIAAALNARKPGAKGY